MAAALAVLLLTLPGPQPAAARPIFPTYPPAETWLWAGSAQHAGRTATTPSDAICDAPQVNTARPGNGKVTLQYGTIAHTFTPDDRGRLKTVTSPLGVIARTYNVDSQLKTETLPHVAGYWVEYEYDPETGRLIGIELKKDGEPAAVLDYKYTYDGPTGRSAGVKAGGTEYTWTYEPNSHLPKNVTFGGAMTLARTYEGNTNRLSAQATAIDGGPTVFANSYAYNLVDQKTYVDVLAYRPSTATTDEFAWHLRYDAEPAVDAGGAVVAVPHDDDALTFRECWTGDDDDPWPARWR